jgi:hypothetical protein
MQNWTLLEQIFTARTIMTPVEELLVWDGLEAVEVVRERAQLDRIDTIPVKLNGRISHVLPEGSGAPQPLTPDWIVTSNTCVSQLVKTFAQRKKACLMVEDDQDVIGVVTHADMNRIPARTFLYGILSELEVMLGRLIKRRKLSNDEIFSAIGDNDERERQAEIQQKLSEADLELEIVDTLYLPEIVSVIRTIDDLRAQLNFDSRNQLDKFMNPLVTLRNDVMHPNKPILHRSRNVMKLHEQIERLTTLLTNHQTLAK